MSIRTLITVLATLVFAVQAQTPAKNEPVIIGPVPDAPSKIPEIHEKDGALLPNITQECNFFHDQGLAQAPWPLNCRFYRSNNNCNKYEISRDGKSVDSCQLQYNCNFTLAQPECLEYYPPRNKSETIFPETGKQCLFKESVYPLNPWPSGCKIF